LSANFRRKGRRPPTTVGVRIAEFNIKISAVHHLVLSQSTCVTHGQTDRIARAIPCAALHAFTRWKWQTEWLKQKLSLCGIILAVVMPKRLWRTEFRDKFQLRHECNVHDNWHTTLDNWLVEVITQNMSLRW